MKRNGILRCLFFLTVLISGTVNETLYKFESNIVRTITEETEDRIPNHPPDSLVCESLIKAEKLLQVCQLLVSNATHRRLRRLRRRIKFTNEQPVAQKVISIKPRQRDDADADKKILSTCKCPTNLPIYLTDGKSADTIMVIVEGRRARDAHGKVSYQIRSPEGNMKYIRYLKYLRMLKGKKSHKKYKFEFGAGEEGEGANIDLASLTDFAEAANGDSGFWEGVSSFFGSLDLGGLDFELGGF